MASYVRRHRCFAAAALLCLPVLFFALARPAEAGTTTLIVGQQGQGFLRIQDAVNVANNGDCIIVNPGVYTEQVDLQNIRLTLRSTAPTNPAVVAATIIDGQSTRNNCIIMNGGQTTSTLIDGFTIRNARRHGIKCNKATNPAGPAIHNCVITGNGGANNTHDGGGIAFCSGQIWDCTIVGNVTGHNGAGVFTDGSAVIRRCLIQNNVASNKGGGVAKGGWIEICRLYGNSADDGGALANGDVVVTNCRFANNTAKFRGGAAQNHTGGEFYNNAFVRNSAKNGGAIADVTGGAAAIDNNIFWLNVATSNGMDTRNVVNRNNCYFGPGRLPANGAGNVTALTPFFANVPADASNPFFWDFHLLAGSICIDTGINLWQAGFLFLTGDIDNPPTPRPIQVGGLWDIGPDER